MKSIARTSRKMGVVAQAENADNLACHARIADSEGSLPPPGSEHVA